MDLTDLGWDEGRTEEWNTRGSDGLIAGRVAEQHRDLYMVLTAAGSLRAELPRRMVHEASTRADLPAVGDWVGVQPSEVGRSLIRIVLRRRSKFSRSAAGFTTDEQVLASNVDGTWIAVPLDRRPNLRGIERYLTMAYAGGTLPVIVATKSDLCDDVLDALERIERVASGADVRLTSAVTSEGVEALRGYLMPAKTVAILGPSGAGKSSLLNGLMGREVAAVNEVRADGKGRHTTTSRALVPVPGGGVILDTPGLRELQLWDADEGIEVAFSDIAELAAGCRFGDCTHEHEPGCAVLEAEADGDLAPERLESYHKLQRELRWLRIKQDARASADAHKKSRAFHRALQQQSRVIKARDAHRR